MDKLIALCCFVLSLFGCEVGGSSFVHRTSADGRDVIHAKAHVQAGVARFECLDSESGQCHYAVYPRECSSHRAPLAAAAAAGGAVAGPVGGCDAAPLQRFAIATGDSRQITGLRDFILCVSADGGVRGRDCEAVEPGGRALRRICGL